MTTDVRALHRPGSGARTFAFIAGDHASWVLRDGAGAVRLARTAGTVAVDIETAGLYAEQWDVRAVVIGTATVAHVLDPFLDRQAIIDALAAATVLVFHNSPFDVPVLVRHGLMATADVAKVYDTIVTARMAEPSEHGGRALVDTCTRHLGADYSRAKHARQAWREVTGLPMAELYRRSGLFSEAYCAYAGFDVIMTARLHTALPAAVVERTTAHPFATSGDPAHLVEREQVVNRTLLARSARGIEVDFDVIDELTGEMLARSAEADVTLERWGIDTSLTREKVKAAAVHRLDDLDLLPAGHRRLLNGEPSADKRQLDRIHHPIVEALSQRSQAERFSTDYVEKVVKLSYEGRLHPQVAVAQAVTGRMAYREPPIQQYPAGVRRMMRFDVPVTSMDWSSIEPVLFANLAGESTLIDTFEAGGDVYEPVARAAGVERKVAKTVLLAQLYGQGAPSLAGRLGITEDAARALVEATLGPFERIRQAKRAIGNLGDQLGLVQTLSGRIIPIDPDPRTGNTRYFGYKAVNYVVQGGAYDLLAEVMLAMHHAGLDDELHAAVHDELVVSSTVADEVEHLMATPPPALVEAAGRTPLLRVGRADLGHHWLSKEHP